MSSKIHYRRILPGLIGVLLVATVGVGVTLLINSFMHAEPPKVKKVVQNITLIKPPPPPPKLEEQPPEPELDDEKVDLPEPEPLEDLPDVASDEAPPGDNLGLDADGSGAGDSFGLIGRKGGRSLLDGAGSAAARFAGQVQKQIQQALYGDDSLRHREYSVVLRIWVDFDGTIQRADLDGSTGQRAMDEKIESTIASLPRLALMPPPDMPMPIRLRITASM